MLVSLDPDPNRRGEHGSVFIVVVAVIMLVGVLLVLGVGGFGLQDNNDRISSTNRRQEFLIRELAAYVQRTNTLPCPADPAIDPSSRDFGFARVSCGINQTDGIVPFRTLNLSEHDALDGWNRFMTYKISPVLADTNKGNSIFMRCRRFPWFEGDAPPPARPVNVYPQKARFCCPPEDGFFPHATDLQVFAAASDISAGLTINKIGRKGDPSWYDDIDKPVNIGPQGALAPVPPEAGNEELFAVAIISHGRNGIGAYLANGTNGRLSGSVGLDEEVNLSGGWNHVVSRPINTTPGPNYFDDIVIWRTQLGLMGELNNASCYAPWK
jgi:hypothetical protein